MKRDLLREVDTIDLPMKYFDNFYFEFYDVPKNWQQKVSFFVKMLCSN